MQELCPAHGRKKTNGAMIDELIKAIRFWS